MEIDIDRVDFMVSLNSFHEELTSKLIQLQGL